MMPRNTVTALLLAALAAGELHAQQQTLDFAVQAPVVLVMPGGRQRGFGKGQTAPNQLGAALAAAVTAVGSTEGCSIFLMPALGGAGYDTGEATLTLPSGTTLACAGGRARITGDPSGEFLINIAGDRITLRNLEIEPYHETGTAVGCSLGSPANRVGILFENVRILCQQDEGSAVRFNNVNLEFEAVNCEFRSPAAAGGAGFGLYANMAASWSRMRLINCTMFGDTDAVLATGHASGRVTIEGGDYRSTLDAITSGGPAIEVRGAKARGDQADLYADGGQVDAWGCDVRADLVVGANARTHLLDFPVVSNGDLPLGPMIFAQTDATNIRNLINAASSSFPFFNGGSQTGASNPVGIFSQEWDNAGTIFKAVQIAIQNTASNAASRLLELTVGGADRFVVYRDGGISCASLNGSGYYSSIPVMADYLVSNTNPVWLFRNSGGVLALQGRSTVKYGWTNNGSDAGAASANTNLARAAEGVVSIEGPTNATGATLRFVPSRPAAIAAAVNDYNPGTNSKYAFLSASGTNRTISGIGLSPAQVDGQELIVCNTGSANLLTLQPENSGSAAANRFTHAAVIPPGGSAHLVYDGTASRWRVIGGWLSTDGS